MRNAPTGTSLCLDRVIGRKNPASAGLLVPFRAGILPAVLDPVMMFANIVALAVVYIGLGRRNASSGNDECGEDEKNLSHERLPELRT